MRKVAVVGAGKIGSTVLELLIQSGAYEVVVIDQSKAALKALPTRGHPEKIHLPVETPQALAQALRGCFAVISCAPYHLTTVVAQAAKAARVHYLDLTEDVAASRIVRELAADSETAFIPQCGLAPGFITIAA
ncbi:MAG: saccharopine dehydrogenase, partial [Caulobacteraceae bacterium]|nr:saccharopine dehydrogenase [Caulobacteraceae bacterium]